MREAHPVERTVGVEFYVSDRDGTGGRLRATPADFRVRERETVDPEPVDAAPGDYAHVLLRVTLTDWDTNDFAARLSDALGVSRERVSWAGTKDKRAVTTQLFSVRDVDPGAVPEIDGAEIEVVGRFGRALRFGDLAGNEFVVRVRDAERPDAVAAVSRDLRAFARGDRGDAGGDGDDAGGDGRGDDASGVVAVPNYFGQQRFGSRRPVTHEVGLHVARGEWREAVLAYAGNPFEAEPDSTREARAFVEREAGRDDPDWAAAAERMPGRLRFERSMLHRLAERSDGPGDYRRALEAVPSNLQRLFVNAAQSYAFNRVLSERLRRGLPFARPVAGDVVCFADGDVDGAPVPDEDRTQRVTEERVDVVARHCERGRAFVTAPLVGTDVELAAGVPGEIERGVLDDVGLSPSMFDLPGNFASRGTRRAALVRTDLSVDSVDGDPRFSFALPSGSYATVLLREYLKTDPLER
jgi:tRNA pseudouridine13 synthase